MKNKMFLILGAIIILFGALYFVIDYKNKEAVDSGGNPYGKDALHQATIDQLDDPLYQNQITPEKLDELVEEQDTLTVYFYSPTCDHCLKTTPVLMPLADELYVDIKKLNLLEFDDKWDTYGVEGTPTLIHYKDGEEVARVEGSQPEETFQSFFDEYVLE